MILLKTLRALINVLKTIHSFLFSLHKYSYTVACSISLVLSVYFKCLCVSFSLFRDHKCPFCKSHLCSLCVSSVCHLSNLFSLCVSLVLSENLICPLCESHLFFLRVSPVLAVSLTCPLCESHLSSL